MLPNCVRHRCLARKTARETIDSRGKLLRGSYHYYVGADFSPHRDGSNCHQTHRSTGMGWSSEGVRIFRLQMVSTRCCRAPPAMN